MFSKAYQIDLTKPVSSNELLEILVEEYGYNINESELSKDEALVNLRSVFIPKTKTLLLANGINEAQRTFIYAKEIAYNFMNIEYRLYTFLGLSLEFLMRFLIISTLPILQEH